MKNKKYTLDEHSLQANLNNLERKNKSAPLPTKESGALRIVDTVYFLVLSYGIAGFEFDIDRKYIRIKLKEK